MNTSTATATTDAFAPALVTEKVLLLAWQLAAVYSLVTVGELARTLAAILAEGGSYPRRPTTLAVICNALREGAAGHRTTDTEGAKRLDAVANAVDALRVEKYAAAANNAAEAQGYANGAEFLDQYEAG